MLALPAVLRTLPSGRGGTLRPLQGMLSYPEQGAGSVDPSARPVRPSLFPGAPKRCSRFCPGPLVTTLRQHCKIWDKGTALTVPDVQVSSTARDPNRRADHPSHIPTDLCARPLARDPVAEQVFQPRKTHLYGDFKKSTHGRPHTNPEMSAEMARRQCAPSTLPALVPY